MYAGQGARRRGTHGAGVRCRDTAGTPEPTGTRQPPDWRGVPRTAEPARTSCERTSPCTGRTCDLPCRDAIAGACSCGRPPTRYRRWAVAAPARMVSAGERGGPPRPYAHAGRLDSVPRAFPAWAETPGQVGALAGSRGAAGAHCDRGQGWPAVPDSPATHNGGYAGSPWGAHVGAMWRTELCGEDDTNVDFTVVLT